MYESFPYVEPCCSQTQLSEIAARLNKSGVVNIFTYSDVTPATLLEWLALYIPMSTMTFVLINIQQQTAEILARLLSRSYYNAETGENEHYVSHLNIITRGCDRAVTSALESRFPGRVTVAVDPKVAFRCLTMKRGDRHLVLQGSIYQSTKSGALQMLTLMSSPTVYADTHRVLDSILKVKHSPSHTPVTVPAAPATVPEAFPSGSTTVPAASPAGSTTVPDASPSGSQPSSDEPL